MTQISGSTAVACVPPTTANSSTVRRIVAVVIAVCSFCVLAVAAWLEPSPVGLGTHTQISPFACSWILSADLPCPTCGMTTAFAHAANGDLISSFITQPMGCILALATSMVLIVSVYIAVTGSAIASVFPRLWSKGMALGIALAVVVGWGYKIASYKEWLSW